MPKNNASTNAPAATGSVPPPTADVTETAPTALATRAELDVLRQEFRAARQELVARVDSIDFAQLKGFPAELARLQQQLAALGKPAEQRTDEVYDLRRRVDAIDDYMKRANLS